MTTPIFTNIHKYLGDSSFSQLHLQLHLNCYFPSPTALTPSNAQPIDRYSKYSTQKFQKILHTCRQLGKMTYTLTLSTYVWRFLFSIRCRLFYTSSTLHYNTRTVPYTTHTHTVQYNILSRTLRQEGYFCDETD